MLNLAVTLLIIALIAAVLGFGGVAVVSVELAKIVFFVAIVLFLIAAIFGTPWAKTTGGIAPAGLPSRLFNSECPVPKRERTLCISKFFRYAKERSSLRLGGSYRAAIA
jgi:uncharacterized membrane protein YtjA (UPF0391 family)